MLWKSREGKKKRNKNHTCSSSQSKNSPPPTFSKLYPGKCSLFTMPDTLWMLPGRVSICKLDLCERSESPRETLAKASTKSSSGGAGWRGCHRSLGRERGSPIREKPTVLIKASRAGTAETLLLFSPAATSQTQHLGQLGWQFFNGN